METAETKKNVFQGFSEDDEAISTLGSQDKDGDKDDASKGESGKSGTDKGEGTQDDKRKQPDKPAEKDDTSKGEEGEEKEDEDKGDDSGEGKGEESKEGDDIDPDKKEQGKDEQEEPEFELKLDDEEKSDDDPEKGKPINYLSDAKDLGLEIEEETTELTKEEFVMLVNEKIENSKQEFSYKGIPEDSVEVVKFFAEEGGTVTDLLSDNDVVIASSLLAMNDRDKVLMQKTQSFVNAGIDKEEAKERALEALDEMTEEDLARAVTRIDQELVAYKKQAITNAVKLRNTIAQKEREKDKVKAQAQQKEMVKVVKAMDKFMGMKVTPPVRDRIISQIESGDFDKTIKTSLAKAKVDAFMMLKFGKQIQELQQEYLKTRTASSYNQGVKKYIDKNHNARPESREKSQSAGGEKSKWEGIKDID